MSTGLSNDTLRATDEVAGVGRHSRLLRATLGEDLVPVLLKVLTGRPPMASELERLHNEQKLSTQLSASFIVRSFGLTDHEGQPALVLEDFGGIDLGHALKTLQDVGARLRVAVKLADAVAGLHGLGVVHLDIKPANIIINVRTGDLKLADLGLAARLTTERQSLPSMGALQGTLEYLSPEQTGRMNRGIDFRSDLYSLGITLFELFTGALPFHANDPLEWAHCHIAKVPPVMTDIEPSTPGQVAAIVNRLMQKPAEDRYQTASGLAYDLRRCLEAWEVNRTIPFFSPGLQDFSDRLQLPQKLYGRERELGQLMASFERMVATGKPELTLVAGYSGVGKSSLVNELKMPVSRERGVFISGKFDQLNRHVPYTAIATAGRELVKHLLTYDEVRLDEWRSRIVGSLGQLGRVVTDVIPDLERLIGPQPTVAQLGAVEAQNRFTVVFQRFFSAVAHEQMPVVLFLDDMQWADSASLNLLETLLGAREARSCSFVLAYRDNEVDAAHPFTATVQRLREQQVPVESITVPPLSAESLQALVNDALQVTSDESRDLVKRLVEKTDGNPFFLNEVLKALHRAGVLRFDGARKRWTWRIEELDRLGLSDNVVDLLVRRMSQLGSETREALELAACVGNAFTLEQLATVHGGSADHLKEALQPAVEAGLVAPGYSFLHDRIQQAAYSLIPLDRRAPLHLRIGQQMLRRLSEEEVERNLFEVVSQLNAGQALLTNANERLDLARLNQRAGAKARASTAYDAAQRYFSAAVGLLPPDAWTSVRPLCFNLQVDLAECQYLAGNLQDAEQSFRTTTARSTSSLERGQIYRLQIRLYQVAGNFTEAVRVALLAFETFGLEVPRTPEEAAAAVVAEAAEAKALRGSAPVASLLTLPRMTDPNLVMALSSLEASGPPIYMARPELFSWVALKMVTLSLRHGNTEASCYGYGIYALLLAAAFGEVEDGYEFAQLAIRLNEKFDDVKLRGCMLHLLGDHVNFWKKPYASDLPILEKGFAACVEGGDLIYSNYIGFQSPWHLLESGAKLDDVLRYTEKYATFALNTKYLPVHRTLRFEQQFIRLLKGLTRGPHELSDETFDEAIAVAEVTSAGFGCGVVYHRILKLIAEFMVGDIEAAWHWATEAEKEIGSAFSMPIEISFHYFKALTAARLFAGVPTERQAFLLEVVRGTLAKLQTWSRACPENFAHRESALRAELARMEGRIPEAMQAYEAAVAGARARKHIHDEAIANELAARFYHSMQIESVWAAHLGRARQLYSDWGATEKVRLLGKQHPGAALAQRSDSTSRSDEHELDWHAVVKLSQAIAGEMDFEKLITTLLQLVAEHTGATRGCLLLPENGEFTVMSEVDASGAPMTGEVPQSIIHFVARAGEHVLLEDARVSNAFSSDAYLRQRQPRSLLCLSFGRGGEIEGQFYLENSLLSGVFNQDRLAVLELLGSQVAISLENARLYKSAQDSIRLRDDFLSVASHELKTPLTPLKIELHRLMNRLREAPVPVVSRDALENLIHSSDRQINRLNMLVEDLLDVTRITSGRMSLSVGPFELVALVREIVEAHREQAAAAGCVLKLHAPAQVFGIWDRRRLEQVVVSLLLNALKYAPGKPVAVDIAATEEEVQLAVADQGIGIAPADASRIFERFERVRSSANVGGLGLGLFIARQIVDAHAGSIYVNSVLGEGATFVVTLPRRGRR